VLETERKRAVRGRVALQDGKSVIESTPPVIKPHHGLLHRGHHTDEDDDEGAGAGVMTVRLGVMERVARRGFSGDSGSDRGGVTSDTRLAV
jgi:hypothetical protein